MKQDIVNLWYPIVYSDNFQIISMIVLPFMKIFWNSFEDWIIR